MKFDFVIGNPPYQEETSEGSSTNGQTPRKNVFQHFQMQADLIAKDGSILVYPGGRWLHQSGKGLPQFGKDLINDVKLSIVEYYPNSREVFGSNIDIPDGISIVVKKTAKNTDGFEYIYVNDGDRTSVHTENPGDDLIPLNPADIQIVSKIKAFVKKNDIDYLCPHILSRTLFGIESDFIEKNPNCVRLYQNGDTFDYDTEIKLLTNDKAGPAGRSKWFIAPQKLISQNRAYINEWQVVVSSAHPGGQDGRDNQMEIIDDHSAFGRARVALKSFKTAQEAQNFYKYAQSKIIKYAFLMTDESLTSLGKDVPDILNYSNNSSLIDFTKDIDEQLVLYMCLTKAEIAYISDKVQK